MTSPPCSSGETRPYADLPQGCQVLAEGLAFPEGPAFDHRGDLWCVEMLAGALWRRSAGGEVTRRHVGGRPNGIAIDGAGCVWFCDSGLNAIRRLDPTQDEPLTVVDKIQGQPLPKPNDLAFDPHGNLVFTCPGDSRTEPTGTVCCLTPDGVVRMISDGLCFPNGLAFTADGAKLVLAETRRQRLWIGSWDPATVTWNRPLILTTTAGPIGPDGLAIGANGDIHVAVHGSSQVEIKSPYGEPRGAHSVGQGNPTNCAFDPSGRLGLVVADAGLGRLLSYPDAGRGLPLFMPTLPARAERRSR